MASPLTHLIQDRAARFNERGLNASHKLLKMWYWKLSIGKVD
jgi:hypothetical protein